MSEAIGPTGVRPEAAFGAIPVVMPDHAGRNPPERPVGPVSRRPVGWREILTRAHLPRLLTLCLAVWLHAANSMLTATTLPVAVGDIGGLRLISWAFACT